MRYTIYKITNTLNGKHYIGKHQTENPMDSYFGSGIAIKQAIKTYGKENFTKEILFDFDNEADMNLMERQIITEEYISNPLSYNMAVGGEGGPHFKGRRHSAANCAEIGRRSSSRVVSEETRLKISENNMRRVWTKETGDKIAAKATGRKHSAETKAKIAETLRGRVGRAHTPESKAKISAARVRHIASIICEK